MKSKRKIGNKQKNCVVGNTVSLLWMEPSR